MSRTESLFEQMLVEHRPALLKQARSLCRNHADAEDLVQNTLVRALQRNAQFALGSNARSWLCTIMTRLFIDQFRREKAQPQRAFSPQDEAVLVAVEPELEPRWWSVSSDDLRAALEQLDEGLRTVFVLFAIERRSYAEISARLSRSEGTIASQIFRARKRLKTLLLSKVGP